MARMTLKEYHQLAGQTQKSQPRRNLRNTGESLQSMIDQMNIQYSLKGMASIHRIDQPVRIETRNGSKVIGTLKKSTVDYIGVTTGRGIAFDAKSTS